MLISRKLDLHLDGQDRVQWPRVVRPLSQQAQDARESIKRYIRILYILDK